MPEDSHAPLDLEAYHVAKDARNMEIGLFWQRSNYFLVLSTAIAFGFFSLRDVKYALPLAMFGLVVALLWIAVNLGSKFWQNRWEYRLRLAEERLGPDMNLFSASWETVQEDVRQSFKFRQRGVVHRAYTRLVLLKPSVSFMMTALSLVFVGFWIFLLIMCRTGNGGESGVGGHELVAFVIRHEHEPYPFSLSVFQTLAILVPALWVFYMFVLRRESKPALDIDLTSRIIPDCTF
ncbi:MAG: hypothetical protein ACLP9L_26740 [Thermoguttaceae bacterium]